MLPVWLTSLLEVWANVYWLLFFGFGTLASIAIAYLLGIWPVTGAALFIGGNILLAYRRNRSKDTHGLEAFDDRLPEQQRSSAAERFIHDVTHWKDPDENPS